MMKHLILLLVCAAAAAAGANAQVITTVAGNGTAASSGDGGAATAASINGPVAVYVDSIGEIFIADPNSHKIRKVSKTGIISTVAGTGNPGYTGDGGLAVNATLYHPAGVTMDKKGNIYIGDAGNQVIRKVDKNGIITTFAGTVEGGYNGDEIPATQAHMYNPCDMLVDNAGNLIFSDVKNNRVRKIDTAGIIHTIAGNGNAAYTGDGVAATATSLSNPGCLWYDKAGNLFISDDANNRIRKVNTSGVITTVAGNGQTTFGGDGGLATNAQIAGALGVTGDGAGNIYLSDYGNNRVRKVDKNGIITTITGDGTAAFGGDGGAPALAKVYHPLGLFTDASGNLYICDHDNNRIREITFGPPPTITSFSPTSGGINATIIITGTNFTGATSVTFGGVAAKSFVVNSSTKITAKAGAGASGQVAVTTAAGTATAPGFLYCVTPSVKINSDKTGSFCAGTTVTFTAVPTNGGTSPIYQWLKNGKTAGINSTVYKDSTLQTGDTIKCVLTSNASPCVTFATDTSNAITFTVNPNVLPTAIVTATPGAAVCAGAKITFKAAITNGGSTPVYQWRRNGLNVGGNSPTYVDSLPVTGDSVDVTVTGNATCLEAKTVKSSALIIRVDVPNPVIKITANKDSAICTNTKVTFSATITPSYLWKKNNAVVGTNSNKYIDSALKTNDIVQCFLISTVSACNDAASNIINSNTLKFKVTAPPAKPSSISGPSNVKPNQAGLYFSVTAVTGVTYVWTMPTGALIDSGEGTNKIKVTWGTTSGTVSVMAMNNCGTSAASTKVVTVNAGFAGSVVVDNAGKKEMSQEDNDMRLSPNPARSFATLTFTAKTPGKYSITITDAQNRVLDIKTGVSAKGVNNVKINTAGYARGVYYIVLASKENGMHTMQLVVGG